MVKYENIIFIQGEEAGKIMDYIRKHGELKTLEKLKDDYWFKEGEIKEGELPYGSSDNIFELDRFIMSYNFNIPYIGLIRVI